MKAHPHITQMAPYALAEMTAAPGQKVRSLAQNESLRPPSPKALHAAAQVFSQSMLYPDPDWTALRMALAARFDIATDGILCGSGSLELIGCLARVYLGQDRSALVPAHSYPFFRSAAQMAQARVDTAAEREMTVSVDALIASVAPDTAVVFVANPGNPTGTRIPIREMRRLREGLPAKVLLVIDEAYGEFSDAHEGASFDMVARGDTVVMRTFSKAYGMAGFRVGWGLFPAAIANDIRKVLNPNNISAVSQAAAVAALSDVAYMRETCALTAAMRATALVGLRQAGLSACPSHTNFILIDFGAAEAAQAAERFLHQSGIFLRRQAAAGLPQALRMTIGPQDIVNEAVALLSRWQEDQQP